MAVAARQYTTELAHQFGYSATWTPGMPLSLGAIGTFDKDHIFAPVSSLDRAGIKFSEIGTTASQSFNYATAGAVDVSFKLAGNPSPLAPNIPVSQAGLGMRFNRKHATVFLAEDAREWRIEDQLSLAKEVIYLIKAGFWDKDWAIITHVVRAASTTILIARSAGAGIEFSISAEVAGGGLELLSADMDIRTVASREMQLVIVATGGITPLFRAKRVRPKWWLSQNHELRAAYSDRIEGLLLEEKDLDDDLFEDTPIYNGVSDEIDEDSDEIDEDSGV